MHLFRHYVLVAFRQIIRNKTFATINMLGLALGISCSLLIFLWVRDELQMDNYHANGPSLYRVMERQSYDGKRIAQPNVPGIIAEELNRQFPEIVHASGMEWDNPLTFKVDDKIFKEEGHWVGAQWFQMFTFQLLAGNAKTALQHPNQIALSRKLAEKYFGSVQGAIGKSIRIDDEMDFLVSAIYETQPANTSHRADYLLPWQDYLRRNPWANDWGNNGPWAYVQLREDVDVQAFQAKIKHFLRGKNKAIDGKRFDIELFLQPYAETYLYSEQENGEISSGRILYVRLFSVVALFILVIACINFMNLSTARSVKRAKEVGIRKVVGAERSRLIGQFIGEALLMTALALILAGFIVTSLLPAFNELTGKQIVLPLQELQFWPVLLGLWLITGIVAGSYPALFLSSLQPIKVLKGTLKFKPGARLFRQGLVVVQFGLSLLLIIGTIVVYRQMDYIHHKHLGFDRENLIYVPLEGELLAKYNSFRQELLEQPGIAAISRITNRPHDMGTTTGSPQWPGKDESVQMEFTHAGVGYDLTKTLGLRLIDGRDFSRAFATDTAGYLINQEAARRIGYQAPVGKELTLWGKRGTIIGVVENFHFTSLHDPMEPLIMWFGENSGAGNILVRTLPGQTQQALSSLENLCRIFNPKFPFTYQFVDQEYERLYKSEQIVQTLAGYFAFLAIFISCLGLFGLATFTTEQRTKEIGIRKVLGATVSGIVALLSKDFLKLVGISIAIATPIAWWIMNQWLTRYAYKTDISACIFALAGGITLLIALLTVSYQSIKAALMNPTKSLKNE